MRIRSIALLSRPHSITAPCLHHKLQLQRQCPKSIIPTFRTISSLPGTPIFEALAKHDPNSTAIVHSISQRTFKYGSLLHDVAARKEELGRIARYKSLAGKRVAFLAENSYDYVVTALAILAHDAIGVPLSSTLPPSEIRYVLAHSETAVLLSTKKFENRAREVFTDDFTVKPILNVFGKIQVGASSAEPVALDKASEGGGGLMLYTSGTTNRPKGVVLPESVLTAQARSLIQAWDYSPHDHLLHTLPMHHIHGIVNALITPLMAGSSIEFMYPFNPLAVWERFAAPFVSNPSKDPVTFFTAVPTIYTRLLSTHRELSEELQRSARTGISPEHLRLNISGSAALPTPVKSAWTDLSKGNVLLERYGMTEVGMGLSCGLAQADRVDASVGWPLPSVEVRLVDIDTDKVIELGEEFNSEGQLREGQIQLRGPTIFSQYWNNPEATAKEFVDDPKGGQAWFKTGDVASRQSVPGAGGNTQAWAKGPMYFIKGRQSVDIIKVGGEKVSALEVERELLSLPQIAEVAVIGIKSEQWGQKVAAIVVLNEAQNTTGKSGRLWGVMDMRRSLRDRLASHKIPQVLKIVEGIPRNAMGKINKKQLVRDIFPEDGT